MTDLALALAGAGVGLGRQALRAERGAGQPQAAGRAADPAAPQQRRPRIASRRDDSRA